LKVKQAHLKWCSKLLTNQNRANTIKCIEYLKTKSTILIKQYSKKDIMSKI